VVAAALAGVFVLVGAPPATGDPPRSVSSYYLARVDARRCAIPMCGGIWARLVNRVETRCGDGVPEPECYAAAADLGRLQVGAKRRAELEKLISDGRALVRGRLVRGLVPDFPDLDTLVASEVWIASRSPSEPRGSVRRLRGNGIVCVTAPCYTIHAAELNTGRHVDVSEVDLSPTGAPARERRRALATITTKSSLLASGRAIRRTGAAGRSGRTFVATQFYVRAPG
jgi:hypothetical protein